MTSPWVVEVAFDSQPGDLESSLSWTDVSAYVRGLDTSRGASREHDLNQTGTATIVLSDRDRRFDPDNLSGPYVDTGATQVLPMKPVRIRYVDAGLSVDAGIFNGFVETWTHDYVNDDDATVTLQCSDGFLPLSRARLPSSPYSAEVLADGPKYWWKLGDQDGSTVAYDEMKLVDGVPTGGGVFGVPGLVAFDDDNAYRQPGGATTDRIMAATAEVTTNAMTVEALVQYDLDTLSASRTIVQQGDTSATEYWSLFTDSGGLLTFQYVSTASSSAVQVAGTTDLRDGAIHHVAATVSAAGACKVYVDGVDQTVTPASVTPGPVQEPDISIGQPNPTSSGSNFPGVIDEVAVYETELSAARLLAHALAAFSPWVGDTSDERIDRVLDAIGWPADRRSLDAGDSVLQAAGFDGSALDVLQNITLSELVGSLFMTGDGDVRFISRSNQFGITPTYTLSDRHNSGKDIQSLRPDYGAWLLRNDVTITRADGKAQRVTDAASVADFLTQSYELSGLVHDSDALSLAVADALVAEYGQPKRRISQVTVAPNGDRTNLVPMVTDIELEDWVDVTWTPVDTGSAVTVTSVVEMIQHSVGPEAAWTVTYTLSPAPAGSAVGVITGDSPPAVGLPVTLGRLDNRTQNLESAVLGIAPVGSIVMWPTTSIPSGWLVCEGGSFSSATYPELAAVLGGTTLPDLRDRAPVGKSGSKAINSTGGAASVTIATGNLPAHSHTIAHTHDIFYEYVDIDTAGSGTPAISDLEGGTGGGGTNTTVTSRGSNSANSGNTGSGTALGIQNPYYAIAFIIRAA